MKKYTKTLKAGVSLALISFFAPSVWAAGVVNLTDYESKDDALKALSTPTLDEDSAYTLTEGDTGEIVIAKYLNNGDGTYSEIDYVVNVSSSDGDYVNQSIKPEVGDVYVYGGAIANYSNTASDTLEIEALESNFISNSLYVDFESYTQITFGGAIANYLGYDAASSSLSIKSITGDFINNYIYEYSSFGANGLVAGGAIINYISSNASNAEINIGDIKGDFINNYVDSYFSAVYGGAIANTTEASDAVISMGAITGDFISNYVNAKSGNVAAGGAIYNVGTSNNTVSISSITGSFVDNYASNVAYNQAFGGAIANENASIGNINADFAGNYVTTASSTDTNIDNGVSYYPLVAGGAIYNASASIGDIVGSFIDNYVEATNESNSFDLAGGAIYNTESTIASINADFIGNEVLSTGTGSVVGGAIYNVSFYSDSTIGYSLDGDDVIKGDFINNSVISNYNYANTDVFVAGGAIYNESTYSNDAKIAAITSDFYYNSAETIMGGYGTCVQGGAVYNAALSTGTASIESMTSNFVGNYALTGSTSSYSYVSGGAIYNESAYIGSIDGSFIDNYAKAANGYAYGGAIYNVYGTINSIKGDFENNGVSHSGYYASWNPAYSSYVNGGAIYNNGGAINSIEGNFEYNYAKSENALAYGGAIYNYGSAGKIESIKGSFIGNYSTAYSYACGGAIYNLYGTINIVGDFDSNYVISSSSYAEAGAIYNAYGTMSVEGSFIKNYAQSVSSDYTYGGAIELWGATLNLTANSGNIYSYGNWAGVSEENASVESGGFLYMYDSTLNIDVGDYTMTIGTADSTSEYYGEAYDSIVGTGSIYKTGAGSLTINSSMEYFEGNMYLQGGSFTLSNTFGGTLDISAGTLNVVVSTNNADDSAIINALTISDTTITSDNLYVINVSYADDLTLNQYQSIITIFTENSDLKDIVKLSVALPTGYSSYDWTSSTTYNTVTLTAQGEDGESLSFKTTDDGVTTAVVSGGDFYLGSEDSVDVDAIESDDSYNLVLNGGTATTTTSTLVIANDDSTDSSYLQVASGTIDASAEDASVALSEGTTTVGDFTVIGTLSVASSSDDDSGDDSSSTENSSFVLDAGDDDLTLDKVVLDENVDLSLSGNVYAYADETITAEGSNSSSINVDGESLNATIDAGDIGSVSISSDTVTTATAVSFNSTTANDIGGSTTTSATNLDLDVTFDSSVEGDKTAVSSNVDTVYGSETNVNNKEITSDKVFSGSVSASYTAGTDEDVDADSVAAITTTGGVINLADGTEVSATFTDSEGNLSYGNALTNYHDENDASNTGLTVAVEVGGSAYITGNITANSPLTITATADTITIDGAVDGETNGTTLTVAGGVITTGAEASNTSAAENSLTVNGASLVLTTDGAGTMANFSDVGEIVKTSDGTISVETSVDLLVGAAYTIADETTLYNNNDDLSSLISYDSDSFSLVGGTLTVISLSTFQNEATSENETAFAELVDGISGLTTDDDYDDKIDFKNEVAANGLGSYIMSNYSYIAEVDTMLLSNQNFANVNRARSILEKTAGIQLPDEDGSISFENEDGTISVVDADSVSLIKYSNVAQLQSINMLGSKTASNGVAGYDYWSVGSTANFDEILSENALIGASIGGTYNKVEGDAGDNANSTAFLVNFYGVYANEGFEVFGNIGYAHFWNEGYNSGAKADWDSDAFNFLIGVSYDLKTNLEGFTITPLAMFNLVCLESDSASYSNGVNVDDQSYFSAKLMLGFEFEYAITAQFNAIVRTMYMHEMGDSSYDFTYGAGFATGASYIGGEAGIDAALMGFGLSYDFSETCSLYFDYNAYIYSNLTTHSLNLSVALKF